jgi:hypothetical protein
MEHPRFAMTDPDDGVMVMGLVIWAPLHNAEWLRREANECADDESVNALREF